MILVPALARSLLDKKQNLCPVVLGDDPIWGVMLITVQDSEFSLNSSHSCRRMEFFRHRYWEERVAVAMDDQ